MKKQHILLAATAAAALIFSFPPFKTGFFAFFALIPFFFLIRGMTWRSAALWGYITGVLFYAGTVYWVVLPTVAGGIALMLYLPVYFALLAVLHRFFASRWGNRALWLFPFYWTAVEWFRSLGEMAFPWLSLGYSQSYYTPLIQFIDITGIYGISFWIVLINVLLYFLITERTRMKRVWAYAGAVALLFILPLLYGVTSIPSEPPAADLTVSLVQGNIDPYHKWDRAFVKEIFDTYARLTREAAEEKPDLIVWPETAMPCYLRTNRIYRKKMHALVDSLGIPVLTGAPDYRVNKGGIRRLAYFNAAFLFDPGAPQVTIYNKIILVPFSEKIPFEDRLTFLQKVDLGEADFSYGSDYTLFTTQKGTFATLVCFESLFPALVRTFVEKGASFIVNITNDGWFGRSSGPYQHARMSIFRAIEHRVSIARCTNSGISLFVDPYGRTSGHTRLNEQTVTTGRVTRGPVRQTFFARYGDILSRVCAGISIMAVLANLVLRVRR